MDLHCLPDRVLVPPHMLPSLFKFLQAHAPHHYDLLILYSYTEPYTVSIAHSAVSFRHVL